MCLFTNGIPVTKTTKKDRMFYKILGVCGGTDSELSYFTPYMPYKAQLNTLLEDDNQEYFYSRRICSTFSLGPGGFHLYTSKKAAEEALKVLSHSFQHKYQIFKAIVPKGTKYVEGNTGYSGHRSVIVKKVRYEEL